MKTAFKLILPCLALLLGIYTCEMEKVTGGQSSGSLVKSSECKEFKSTLYGENPADTLSCLEYAYDVENEKLIIKHLNAGFNCCPVKILGKISFDHDTIIIKESEKDGLCDCLCLYDLEYNLSGISEKQYTVRLIEPYRSDQEEFKVVFDLAASAEGSFCLTRKRYPWGIML